MRTDIDQKRLEAEREIEDSRRIVAVSRYLTEPTKEKASELLSGILAALEGGSMDADEAVSLAGRIMGTVVGEIQHGMQASQTSKNTSAVLA